MNKSELIQYFKGIPKADLHNHLTVGISRKSFKELFPNFSYTFPKTYNGLEEMINIIDYEINPVMNDKKSLELILTKAIEDAMHDNVKFLSASIDITLCHYFDDSSIGFCNMLKSLKDKFKGVFNPVLGINKMTPEDELNNLYFDCVKQDTFHGIDLYGPELNQNLEKFIPIFEEADKYSLIKKVHIGEFSDYISIERAINKLNPNEIEHGIRSIDSKNTMSMILERDIKLNICPESNFQLGAVESISSHPIKKLFDFGIDVSINTDDLLIFNKTISEQVADLVEAKIFSINEAEELLQKTLTSKQV